MTTGSTFNTEPERISNQRRAELPQKPKIPNAFTKLHPVDDPQDRPDERPAGIEVDTLLKVILRNGNETKERAGRLWWGDSVPNGSLWDSSESSIVAYRVIKLPVGWIEWMSTQPRGSENVPDIVRENPDALIVTRLRGYGRQVHPARPARRWNWRVDGNDGDIAFYRVLTGNERA